MRHILRFTLICCGGLALLFAPLLCGAQNVLTQAETKPNIVFVLTDDQNEAMLDEMPVLQEELVSKGTTFENTISSDPLCCPGRTTFLRGQYSFNHGVYTNTSPMGGWPRFDELDLETDNLATWLADSPANYRTGLFGKYLNEYSTRRVPPGWDQWVARIGRPAHNKMNVNGVIQSTKGHQDSIFKNRAVKWVDRAAPRDQPFFLWLGFYAPHSPGLYNEKYADRFSDAQVPRTPDYDEADVSDKPQWIRQIEPLTQNTMDHYDELFRRGLRADLTVDHAVRQLTGTLSRHGELDSTYFVFYTDNGTHSGHHRLTHGKSTPYRTDIGFPLIVRGPGIRQGATSNALVSSNDIAPTLAAMSGVGTPAFVDGRSILSQADADTFNDAPWRTAVASFRWRDKSAPLGATARPEWYALAEGDLTYVEWETGEQELYHHDSDPYELDNVYDQASPEEQARMRARLDGLKNCAADSCRTAENGP